LILAFAHFLNIDILLDLTFRKRALQNFIIVQKLPLVPRHPIQLLQAHLPRIHHIDYLAVHCSSPKLLNFCDLKTKKLVDPVKKVGLGDEESPLHHAYTLFF